MEDVVLWGLYVRRSREDRDEEKVPSVEIQREQCEKYANENGLLISEVYSEVVSGKASLEERTELCRMLSDVKEHKIQGVLALDGYRLSRDTVITQMMVSTIKQAGCRLHYVQGGEQDVSSEVGEFMVALQGYFAQIEYQKIRRRFHDGMMNHAGRGEYIWTRSPYGYKKVVRDGNKTLEIVPDEAEMVRKIFDWKKAGVSLREICRRLTESGYQTHYGGAWDMKTISHMLKNPLYIGKIRYNCSRVELDTGEDFFNRKGKKVRKSNPKDVWITVDGFHEGIIDPKTFYLVQSLIDTQPRTKYPFQSENPLAGLVKCACCGYAYTLVGQTGKPQYRQYRHRYKDVRVKCEFADRSINHVTVLRSVVRQLKRDIEDFSVDLSESDLAEDNEKKIEDLKKSIDTLSTKTLKRLVRQRNSAVDELEQLKDDSADTLTIATQQEVVDDYSKRLEDLQLQIRAFSKELKALEETDVKSRLAYNATMETTLSNALFLIEKGDVDAHIVNVFFRTFIEKILIHHEGFKKYDEYVDVEIVYK